MKLFNFVCSMKKESCPFHRNLLFPFGARRKQEFVESNLVDWAALSWAIKIRNLAFFESKLAKNTESWIQVRFCTRCLINQWCSQMLNFRHASSSAVFRLPGVYTDLHTYKLHVTSNDCEKLWEDVGNDRKRIGISDLH